MQGCDVLAPQESVSTEEWLDYNSRVLHPSVGGVDGEVQGCLRNISLCVVAFFFGLWPFFAILYSVSRTVGFLSEGSSARVPTP